MTPNVSVTHPGYSSRVTLFRPSIRRSGACIDSRDAGYASDAETHLPVGARAQARASACVCMCVLRNYVTQEEEKKEQQVRPRKSGYAGGYAAVTQRVTHPFPFRAEVTHA